MRRLEVSGAVRPIHVSLSVKRLIACTKQTSSSVIGVTISKKGGHSLRLGRLTMAQTSNENVQENTALELKA